MNPRLKREVWRINIAGMLGTLYGHLALGELLLYFIAKALHIKQQDWALAAAFIPLTGILHLVSTYLIERLRHRKLQCLLGLAIARLATPAIILLPFITGEGDTRVRLFYLAAALVGEGACNALALSAWSSWIADIVPQEHRGRFFALRFTLNTAVSIGVYLLAGNVIDYFERTGQIRWGYVVVFGGAFLLGELDLIIHAGVADRPMPEHEDGARLLPLLIAPWRHPGFRNLMIYRSVLMFANSLVGPFGSYYLFEQLRLKAPHIALLQCVLMAASAASFWVWHRIGDRVGYRTVSLIVDVLSGVGIIYWWFLPAAHFPVFFGVLIGARVFFGFTSAGSQLASSTLNMNVAPDKHRSTYFAQVTAVMAIASGLGVFCGRWLFVHLDPACGGTFLGTRLSAVHVLIGLLGLLRIFSILIFYRWIPDARAEAARPRIDRILRTNVFRLFPTILPLDSPVPLAERAEHLDAMRALLPEPAQLDLEAALKTVLKDPVHDEDEFYRILGRVRITRERGVDRLLDEVVESAELHISPARARGAANRIKRLYSAGEFAACLRAVRSLARRTTARWSTAMSDSACSVIDALAEAQAAGQEPGEDAVLVALYAYLQIVREPAPGER